MQLKSASRFAVVVGLLSAICAVVVAPDCLGQNSTPAGGAAELTEVDLFGLPDWEHKRIAVDGFMLGLTREQAFEIAKAANLILTPKLPTETEAESKGPCRQVSCGVANVGGNWIGIDLFFEKDRVVKIRVSLPVESDPEVKKVNIAREFKGLTYQFFNHYSDNLRKKILGSAEGRETRRPLGNGPEPFITLIEYDYSQFGVIVHVAINKPNTEPYDLEVDFVAPK